VQHSFPWPELNSASERLNPSVAKKPNIDFDQKPRGAADRGEYRQAAGATSTNVAQGGFLISAFGDKAGSTNLQD
jgi:hypothetical protein